MRVTAHSKLEIDPFDAELQSAHAWRGECIQRFAEIELAIGDALQCLAELRPSLKIKRGGQIRQCFDELKRLTASKGSKVEFVAKSLDDIERFIEWRAHLTHGVLSVSLEKSNKWLLAFQHRDTGGGAARIYAISRSDADEMLERLSKELDTLKRRVVSMPLSLGKRPNSRTPDRADTPSA